MISKDDCILRGYTWEDLCDIRQFDPVVLVTGPRGFKDEPFVAWRLTRLHEAFILGSDPLIITGGAEGIDMMAIDWAEARGLRACIARPNYKKYEDRPKYAPLVRNECMVSLCTRAVGFWSGVNGGTLNTLRHLGRYGREFTVIGLGAF